MATIDKKLLMAALESCEHLMSRADSAIIAEYLARELQAVAEVQSALNGIATERFQAINQHHMLLKKLDEDAAKARENCRHWTRTRRPDASGNNDSYTTCDQCGKEL